MPNVKTDYLDEIKNFLSINYEPISSPLEEDEYTEFKTLKQITKDVCAILPSDWIYESDVYEALQILGFKNLMKTFPEIKDEEGTVIQREQTVPRYFLQKKTAAI